MVKVQKPAPKTLSKLEGPSKKKKLSKVDKPQSDKKQKPQPPKKALPAEGSKEQQENKSKLFKSGVKEAQVVVPSTQRETPRDAPKEKTSKKADKMQKNSGKPLEARKPLVMAPPESPVVATSVNGKKKNKSAAATTAAKKPLVLAPPESPGVAVTAKSKKKNKSAAAATVQSKDKSQQKGKQKQKKGKGVSASIGPLAKPVAKKIGKKAFNKKRKDKTTAKEKKEKPPMPQTFEPMPYDEDKFKEIVNTANIRKVCKALKEIVEKNVAKEKKSIFSDYKYLLNVACFKIPSCPKRMARLNLKHSLVDKDDDVVIVVPDLQRGAKADYEPTIQHFEDLFREAGVEGLKIMPFNQLRTEYTTFEAKRKLCNTYDYFLCDGRLVSQATGFCGRIFQRPRSTFHSVRLENLKSLKSQIDKALRRTAYKQLSKGDLTSIPVGTHKHSEQQLAENIEYVIEQLTTQYPGGLGNMRSLYMKIDITGTESLPLYMSTAEVPEQAPYVVGPREKHMLKLRKDANDVLAKFNMTKEGEIVKLNSTQVERKRKLKEARDILAAEVVSNPDIADDEDTVAKKARKDDSTPAKKAKNTLKKVKWEKAHVEENSDNEEKDSD